jgi:CubicO group peptidase (beta-lactamase class C family)
MDSTRLQHPGPTPTPDVPCPRPHAAIEEFRDLARIFTSPPHHRAGNGRTHEEVDLMLRIVSILALTGVFAGCSVSVVRPSDAAPHAPGAAIIHGASAAQLAAVDSAMAPFNDTTPGAVVAVVRGGELVFARGYGMADLSHEVPFEATTITNIGSTAKQFTAFGILLLQQRDRLSIDDDIRRHVPELPDFGPTVTLRHLLTHTSGYREFINLLLLEGRQVLEGDHVARAAVIEAVQRQPRLQNEPGAEFNYNNTGYGLLATVIERVTGQDFDAWMAQEVFRPLGMVDTRVRLRDGQLVPRRAAGYVRDGDVFLEARDLGGAAGAGGVYTTVADLARWMRNLHTGELGGRDLVAAMSTSYVLPGGAPTGYGFGLMMDVAQGLRRWHHGGGDTAHRSHFYYYPDLDAGYMVLSNHAAFPAAVPNRVARIFFGEHMTAPPAAEAPVAEQAHVVPPAALDRYVGRFALDPAPDFVLTFTRHEDGLRAQGTGQPAFDLRALTDTTFMLVGVPVRVTFHVAADGSVQRLTLHQNGDHGATRIPEQPAPEPAQFVGRYFSAELDTFLTVTADDGTLAISHRRYGPLALSHAGGDRFNGPLPITEAAFERDAAGRVTGFRVSAGGRTRDVLFERVGTGMPGG